MNCCEVVDRLLMCSEDWNDKRERRQGLEGGDLRKQIQPVPCRSGAQHWLRSSCPLGQLLLPHGECPRRAVGDDRKKDRPERGGLLYLIL